MENRNKITFPISAWHCSRDLYSALSQHPSLFPSISFSLPSLSCQLFPNKVWGSHIVCHHLLLFLPSIQYYFFPISHFISGNECASGLLSVGDFWPHRGTRGSSSDFAQHASLNKISFTSNFLELWSLTWGPLSKLLWKILFIFVWHKKKRGVLVKATDTLHFCAKCPLYLYLNACSHLHLGHWCFTLLLLFSFSPLSSPPWPFL